MDDKRKTTLSKSVLDMKFMKKTKDRVEKEADDAEGQAMYSQEITEEMRKSGNVIFVDASMVLCKDLIEGRLSFGGMNPDIEKYMQESYSKRVGESDKKKEKDVSDAEMAKNYSTLVDTMGKKFNNKGRFNTSGFKPGKNKFIKPPSE